MAWILLFALGLLLPDWSWAQSYPPSVTELVARTKAQVRTIDMATFKAELDQKSVGLVVDVREPGEYAEGHIPGAINIPRGVIELNIWPHVGYPGNADLTQEITLYCGSGVRCVLAAKSLQDLNFSNVSAVDMSIEAWRPAGYSLTRN
jgi:rhodanese-related sulfurtransferase